MRLDSNKYQIMRRILQPDVELARVIPSINNTLSTIEYMPFCRFPVFAQKNQQNIAKQVEIAILFLLAQCGFEEMTPQPTPNAWYDVRLLTFLSKTCTFPLSTGGTSRVSIRLGAVLLLNVNHDNYRTYL